MKNTQDEFLKLFIKEIETINKNKKILHNDEKIKNYLRSCYYNENENKILKKVYGVLLFNFTSIFNS